MKAQWYAKKWITILVHIVLWLLLFSLPFLLRSPYDNNAAHKEPAHHPGYLYHYFFSCIIWITVFYLNAYLFIPGYINKRKYRLYALTQLILLLVVLFLDWLSFKLFIPEAKFIVQNFFIFNTFPYLFIMASSTAYQMFLYRIELERTAKEKETENLKTELSFLRSQVSPHFMFNVLNNMVALARKKSDVLEPSLIKLSSLLRYMLYETDEEKVSLAKEIDYLQSYIDLQQQRFGKNILINVGIQPVDTSYEIEPMLLIPFVENAFKHGVGLIEEAQIDIELTVKHSVLQFFVRNRYSNEITEIRDKTSGIGLNNVKRRLNLLYGNQYSLLINKKEGWFTVSLQIKLH